MPQLMCWGQTTGQALVLGEQVADLTSAHAYVAGGNLGVLAEVAVELGYEGPLEVEELVIPKFTDGWNWMPPCTVRWGSSMFVTYILSKIRAYKLYRQTVNELSELSDRELADLGMSRFGIAIVARTATFA
jgi:uncharacterized protein YjiS (DUF1127 family)